MPHTDEEYTEMLNRRNSDVEFQWKNFHLHFFGMDTRTILLGLLMLACTAYIGVNWWEDRQIDAASKKDYLAAHKLTQTILSTVIDNQQATLSLIRESQKQSNHIVDSVDETAYILTLTQQRREALHMEMPQSLRKKLNER